ncbi:MAG: hypothetical protein WC813_04510 [Patescibacteria group bacterium]|jgi:hypothetical protein
MSDDIKNLFIVKGDFNKQTAEEQATRAIKFGRITSDGTVVVDAKNLSKVQQLRLCLVIRHIAHCFQEEIPGTVRPSELVKVLGQRMEAIGSGLSKLASEGFVKKEGHGEYSVYTYKIDAFLSELEKSADTEGGVRTMKKKTRSSKAFTGIGSHIQTLVNDGFFSTPKPMFDVVSELEKNNVFRDSRVIDKTIRDSFIARKILTRVKNDGKGKSRWLYVVYK